MTRVFVVILNWNRPGDTIEGLKSVGQSQVTGYELNVVVVDNASDDNSVDLITRKTESATQKLSGLKIIKNKENLGYAGGNNIGISYALKGGADYVMVLNNDTLVDVNLISRFVEMVQKHPDVGIFSPKIYFAKGFEFHKEWYRKSEFGRVIWYAGGTIDWHNVYATNLGVDEVDRGQFANKREIDFATGACMFIKAESLKKTGIFDERYFMYFEDADLSLRMKKFGWKVLFVPKAILWHKVAQSSKIGSDLNDYYIHRNRLLFGIRYAPMHAKLALLKESVRFLFFGRPWQKKGVRDFYLGKLGRESW